MAWVMSRPFLLLWVSIFSNASMMSAMSSTSMDAISGLVLLRSLAIHPLSPRILFPVSIFWVSWMKWFRQCLRCW